MTRTLGAGRWRQMPGRVAITLQRQLTPGTFTPLRVADAWYRRGVAAEKAPTAGVYVGTATDWYLPMELLAGVVPRPGDRIDSSVDGLAATDTVLTRQNALAQTVWRLNCLSLELAFGLTDTVDLEQYSLGKDASLGVARTPGALALGLQARVQLLTEQEARERGLEYSEGQAEITLPSVPDGFDVVNGLATHRETGQKYATVSLRNPQRLDELPVLVCRRQA